MSALDDLAVGVIEVRGLASAILAGDLMVKTAAVSLVARHKVGAGLVALVVVGDIASVDASVTAARSAALVKTASVVLGRPAAEVAALLHPTGEPAPPSRTSKAQRETGAGAEG